MTYLNYIIEFSLNLLESCLWLKTLNIFLSPRYEKKYHIFSMCIAWFLLSLKTVFSWNYGSTIVPIISFILCILFMGGCTFTMYSNSIMNKVIVFATYLCCTAAVELFIIGILYLTIPNISLDKFTTDTIYRYGTSLTGISLLFLLLELIKSKKVIVLHIENKVRNMIAGIISIDFILFFVVYIFFNQVNNFSTDSIIIFVGCIVFVITIYSIFLIYRLYKNAEETMEYQLKFQNMQTKLELNMDMSIVTNNLRSLKHDISNHLSIINGLLKTNQLSSLSSYLNSLLQEVYAANDFITVDNEVLCIILNNKKTIATEKGINFDCFISTNMSKFSDMEICSLFGNLLDNAIEATDKLNDNKYIDFKIYSKQNDYIIECENPCNEIPLIKNNKIVTTKENNKIHGIGTKNIYDIVKRYNGNVNYFFNDGICNVKICVPID